MVQHKRWWETAGVILGIVLLVVVTRMLLKAQPPATNPTPETVMPLAATPSAEATPTIAATQTPAATAPAAQATVVPLCTFTTAAQVTPTANSHLNGYTLSEPQVVLTSSTPLGVVEWLPDAEGLLLTHYISRGIESLEILNIATGRRHLYAQRQSNDEKPLWMPIIGAVVYSDNIDQQLRISYGNPQTTESLLSDVNGFSVTKEGTRLLLFSQQQDTNQLQRLDLSTQSMEVIPINLGPLLQDSIQNREKSDNLKTAWRLGYEQVALYGRTGAFLVDLNAKTFCKVNFPGNQDANRTILGAEWSQDERYLAMISTAPLRHGQLPSFSKLVLLDVNNSEIFDMKLDTLFLGDISWSPDSQSLAVLGLEKEQFESGSARLKLLIVNIADKKYCSVYPDQNFGNSGIRWGQGKRGESSIALACPVWPQGDGKWITEQRICVINAIPGKR